MPKYKIEMTYKGEVIIEAKDKEELNKKLKTAPVKVKEVIEKRKIKEV